MLTGLKRKEFVVWVNGVEWKNKFSIGEICPKIIKAISKDFERTYNLMSVINYDILNVQSLLFNGNEIKFSLICPKIQLFEKQS
jgi:hypothetical protein